MGRITERLRRDFRAALKRKIVPIEAIHRGEENAASIQTVDDLIKNGRHPLHAVYTNVANLINLFVEQLADLPGFHRQYKFLLKAQDLYTPGYPPISPITVSYYAHWTAFDVAFGPDNETFGDCWVGISDLLDLDPIQLEAARNLCLSRNGIYEVASESGVGQFQLREVVTDREMETMFPSGFKGRPGELILARVLPPLDSFPSPHVAVTTPYILLGCAKADWIEYFQRQNIVPGAPGAEERYYRHMKRGRDDWYWTEFLFYGYVNHRSDAIFLAGFPDRPETQPHHDAFDERHSRSVA